MRLKVYIFDGKKRKKKFKRGFGKIEKYGFLGLSQNKEQNEFWKVPVLADIIVILELGHSLGVQPNEHQLIISNIEHFMRICNSPNKKRLAFMYLLMLK